MSCPYANRRPSARRTHVALVAIALALGGVGCASVGGVASFEGPFVAGVGIENFPAARLTFAGFRPDAPAAWHFGDSLLYGMQFRVDGKTTRRMLRMFALSDHELPELHPGMSLKEREDAIEFTSIASGSPRTYGMTLKGDVKPQRKFSSRAGPVQVSILDESGEQQSTRTVNVPVDLLCSGFTYFCESNAKFIKQLGADGKYREEDEAKFDWRALAALFSVVRTVQDEEILRRQLMELVTVADKMAALFSGFDFTIVPDFRAVTQISPPVGIPVSGDVWTLPATLMAGNRELLHLQLIFTEPTPPLHLTAGLLAIRGVHAHYETSTFELLLVGARTPPTRHR